MKIIIIEDEKPAAEKLQALLASIDHSLEVTAVLNSVQASLNWFSTNEMPELIFMDIELTDGLSFTIFDNCKISCPVIFTTAYDEYWQEAFEHNSIDYLLKPVKKEKVEATLKKYYLLGKHFTANLQRLLQSQEEPKAAYKKRFLVKRGVDLLSIKLEDISYFYATHKLVCLVTFNNQKYILDKSLSDIEKETDPALFFRANRKYLISANAIKRMKTHSKGKLQLEVEPVIDEEIVISQENAGLFKEWIAS
jgi:DNA-binding LytR/AlgR family response regulator